MEAIRSETQNALVVFEGLDGAGKSVLGKALAEQVCGVFTATPPEEYLAIRRDVHACPVTAARFCYYISGAIYASDRTRREHHGKIIVCDRYYYTSLADYSFYAQIAKPEVIHWAEFLKSVCREPDFVVYCHARRDVRLERISRRNAASVADDLDYSFEVHMDALYRTLPDHQRLLILDTSDRTVDECCAEIRKDKRFRHIAEKLRHE